MMNMELFLNSESNKEIISILCMGDFFVRRLALIMNLLAVKRFL